MNSESQFRSAKGQEGKEDWKRPGSIKGPTVNSDTRGRASLPPRAPVTSFVGRLLSQPFEDRIGSKAEMSATRKQPLT